MTDVIVGSRDDAHQCSDYICWINTRSGKSLLYWCHKSPLMSKIYLSISWVLCYIETLGSRTIAYVLSQLYVLTFSL